VPGKSDPPQTAGVAAGCGLKPIPAIVTVGLVDPSCEPEKLTDPMIGDACAIAGRATPTNISAAIATTARTGSVILEITPITLFPEAGMSRSLPQQGRRRNRKPLEG